MEIEITPESLAAAQQQWTCPPELASAPVPRRVRIIRRSKIVIVVFSLGVMGIFAYSFVDSWRESQREQLLDRDGVEVQSRITGKRTGSDVESPNYWVTYSYRAGQRTYYAEAEVPSDFYERVKIKSPIAIKYAASQPELSRLNGEIRDSPWNITLFLPLLALLPALQLVSMRREKRLLALGQPVCAIVDKVTNSDEGFVVSYKFLASSGTFIAGRRGWRPKKIILKPGETLTVLYDPTRLKHNLPYPCYWVELVK